MADVALSYHGNTCPLVQKVNFPIGNNTMEKLRWKVGHPVYEGSLQKPDGGNLEVVNQLNLT